MYLFVITFFYDDKKNNKIIIIIITKVNLNNFYNFIVLQIIFFIITFIFSL